MSDTTTTTPQLERFQAQDTSLTGVERSSSLQPCSPPPCCGTGCAVCVLDYWEPNESESEAEAEALAMLEAIEQAQSQARRMIAEQDGDSR